MVFSFLSFVLGRLEVRTIRHERSMASSHAGIADFSSLQVENPSAAILNLKSAIYNLQFLTDTESSA